MGMGEPLLNHINLVKAIKKMKHESGLNFSAKKITISTSGIPKIIKNIADENLNCNLAVSLQKQENLLCLFQKNSLWRI
jgi:23S rRNA (adenine2503-C2)-methyltransferase